MKIVLAQHGGLAGIARPPLVLDADELNEMDKAELARLIDAAAAKDAPAPSGLVRDGMRYAITVETGTDAPLVMKQSDGALSPEFARLADWVRRKA
jgi:hypothetical protein